MNQKPTTDETFESHRATPGTGTVTLSWQTDAKSIMANSHKQGLPGSAMNSWGPLMIDYPESLARMRIYSPLQISTSQRLLFASLNNMLKDRLSKRRQKHSANSQSKVYQEAQ